MTKIRLLSFDVRPPFVAFDADCRDIIACVTQRRRDEVELYVNCRAIRPVIYRTVAV